MITHLLKYLAGQMTEAVVIERTHMQKGLATKKNYSTFLYVNTFVIVLLGAAVAGWAVSFLFPTNPGQGFHNTLAAVQAIRKALLWKVLSVYASVSVVITLAMVVLHLFYSHRIAGPAYRLGLEAAKIAQGDLTCNFSFRSKDNLADMRNFLNDVASQYGSRISEITACLDTLEMQSRSTADLIRKGRDTAALRQSAEEIEINIKKIGGSLSEIRT